MLVASAMATLESEVAPILRAASRQERAAPVRAARASASPALDGGSREISKDALMYGARETDAAHEAERVEGGQERGDN